MGCFRLLRILPADFSLLYEARERQRFEQYFSAGPCRPGAHGWPHSRHTLSMDRSSLTGRCDSHQTGHLPGPGDFLSAARHPGCLQVRFSISTPTKSVTPWEVAASPGSWTFEPFLGFCALTGGHGQPPVLGLPPGGMRCLACRAEVAGLALGSARNAAVFVVMPEVPTSSKDAFVTTPAGDDSAAIDLGLPPGSGASVVGVVATLGCRPALPVSLGSVCRAESAVGLGVNDRGATGTCANLHGTSS